MIKVGLRERVYREQYLKSKAYASIGRQDMKSEVQFKIFQQRKI